MGQRRDYSQARCEYEQGVPLAELARKYSIPLSTLSSASIRENWSGRRLLRSLEREQADSAAELGGERVRRLVNKLLERLEAEVDALEGGDVQSLRQLTGVLKDLRSLTDCRDALDREEQLVRIEKLRAEVRGHDRPDAAVTVSFVDTDDCET